MSVIEEKWPENLQEVFSSLKGSDELISIGRGIIDALFELHNNGYVHADIKLDNVLVMKDPHTNVRTAKLSDFSFVQKAEVGKPLSEPRGSYAAMMPPERLAARRFSGNHFLVDTFSLGCLLYKLLMKKSPPWFPLVEAYECAKEQAQKDSLLQEIRTEMQRTIEKPRDFLCKKQKIEGLTKGEALALATYQLLRISPDDRWSITEAKNFFSTNFTFLF